MKKIIIVWSLALATILTMSHCTHEYDNFGSIYGVITDKDTGIPLENATTVLSPGGKTKITGSDGLFEFSDLEAQQYTITVQKTGYQTNRKTVSIVIGEKTEANIPLTKNN